MKPEVALCLNRVGLLLDFLAFWFAAPELLGEQRLKAAENILEGILSAILRLTRKWVKADKYSDYQRIRGLSCLSILVVTVIVLFGILGGWKETWWLGWIPLALAILLPLGILTLLPRWLRALANDQRIRQRSLLLAALMYMFGFALQFVATF